VRRAPSCTTLRRDDLGSGEPEIDGARRIYRDRHGVLIWWYGAPDGANIHDPAVWHAANPASWLREGEELRREYQRLRSRGAIGEWRTYHLDQFVEQLERWMPEEAWDACVGDPVFKTDLPVYACVRIAHDMRSGAVALAQRQTGKILLRVRTFPERVLNEREYLPAEPIED
jgi:phage terminase large subunit-like protein